MFENLKELCLNATDIQLHYAALIVFHELTTRRLGGQMTIDASGNTVVMVESPTTATAAATRKARSRTPKKTETKQEAMDAMFAGRIVVSEDELGEAALNDVLENVGEGAAASASESPTPSAARPIPPPKTKKAVPVKSRDPS